MKRIAKVLTTVKNGVGGHYYSAIEISNALSELCEIVIINIGRVPSPVLSESWSGKFVFIDASSSNLSELFERFRDVVSSERVDVVHTYDLMALLFARSALRGANWALVHTKCGGPPLTEYYGNLRKMVVFTREDELFLRSSRGCSISEIHRIENRVGLVDQDLPTIAKLQAMCGDGLVVLRIGRISEAYKKSFLSSAKLVQFLRSHGVNVKLVLVGSIQDEHVFDELAKRIQDAVWLTEEIYTSKASRLIGLADVVIGNGRSFMEAAVVGKLAMIHSDRAEHPILVSKTNFDDAFAVNFSPRYNPSPNDLDLDGILKVVSVREDRLIASEELKALAEKSFLIRAALGKYSELYELEPYRIDLGPVACLSDRYRLKRFYSASNAGLGGFTGWVLRRLKAVVVFLAERTAYSK